MFRLIKQSLRHNRLELSQRNYAGYNVNNSANRVRKLDWYDPKELLISNRIYKYYRIFQKTGFVSGMEVAQFPLYQDIDNGVVRKIHPNYSYHKGQDIEHDLVVINLALPNPMQSEIALNFKNPDNFFRIRGLLIQPLIMYDVIHRIGILSGIIIFAAGLYPIGIKYHLCNINGSSIVIVSHFTETEPILKDDPLRIAVKISDFHEDLAYHPYMNCDKIFDSNYQYAFLQGLYLAHQRLSKSSQNTQNNFIFRSLVHVMTE